MNNPYFDIINLPHHVSHNHPQMSTHDRAAQFSPFAALTGYEDAIDETARLTDEKRELCETEQTELNKRLIFLSARLKEQPEISIEYFVPDTRKVGGSYKLKIGVVRKITLPERILTMSDGETFSLDDIVAIGGSIFDSMPE